MKLFQYWDTGDPPDDVAACIESFRVMNPEMQHRLFSRDGAAWFISKWLGRRERDAFEALAVPAMQADYFRLCAVWARGGVWVDADSIALKPMASLFGEAPGFLSMWQGQLQSHVILSRQAANPFFGAALELATRHIEQRKEGKAVEVTGPHVLNLIWSEIDAEGWHEREHLRRCQCPLRSPDGAAVAALFPGAGEAFTGIAREHDWVTRQWAFEVEDAPYKQTVADWRRWRAPIYQQVPVLVR